MKVKLIHEKAQMPTRATPGSAGLDLYCIERVEIPPRAQAVLPTGLQIELPGRCYGRIAPRSGLAVKHMINTHAGVIDRDYRGEIKVCLINHGDAPVEFRPGDRIAQLVIEQCYMGPVVQVEDVSDSKRGQGGFGSTGL